MANLITMPKLGFDMAEGKLVRWVKNEGEKISKGDVIAEIETDKAVVEVESNFSGFIRRLLIKEGTILTINSPMAVVGTQDEDIQPLIQPMPSEPIKTIREKRKTQAENEPSLKDVPVENQLSSGVDPSHPKVSPLARKIASEWGISVRDIIGSGPGGRIVRKDIEAIHAMPTDVGTTAMDGDDKIAMSKLRKKIALRMKKSKQEIPHFYITRYYDVGRLLDVRTQINNILPEKEFISINDLVVKAVALALGEFPNLNASLEGTDIIHHKHVNIGIAVSIEGGLLTVVTRDADQKTLWEISGEIKQMVERARSGKIKPSDIEGSTFSISNLGMYSVDEFTAIINPPEAAIIALGVAKQIAIVENGEIQIGWRMNATISVDHRISDGVEAARFMQELGGYLEQPIRLLLPVSAS
jgi:pyruvate dehydrogenase E2 component (dihydrolipoamide acetyltransferase)